MPVFRFRNTHAALKKLEQKGYVTRTRSEEDERVLIAAITPKGEDLKDEAVLIPQKMMACAALPQEKAAQLYTCLLYTSDAADD